LTSVPATRPASLSKLTCPLAFALLLAVFVPSTRLAAQDAAAATATAAKSDALADLSNAAVSNADLSTSVAPTPATSGGEVSSLYTGPAPDAHLSSTAEPGPYSISNPDAGTNQDADADSNASPDKPAKPVKIRRHDFNDDIHYQFKMEYSQELGVLPINIPFVFDIFIGSEYDQKPLHYTLVPVEPSFRWQMGKLNGPGWLRGNTELELSPTFTSVVRGPESRYEAFVLGFRRNFVPPNSHPTAYFDFRMGAGWIDAQEPHGVEYAQGQDFTFTLQMGSGCRYNFSPKYAMSLGFNYMHVSNLYLSEPKYPNNGINVWGPQAGFYVRLGKPKQPHNS